MATNKRSHFDTNRIGMVRFAILLFYVIFGGNIVNVDAQEDCKGSFPVTEVWNGGLKGQINLKITENTESWTLTSTTKIKLEDVNFWAGTVETKDGGFTFTVRSFDWAGKHSAGTIYKTGYVLSYSGLKSPTEVFKDESMSLTVIHSDGSSNTCMIKINSSPQPNPDPSPDPNPDPKPDPSPDPKPDPQPDSCKNYKEALRLSLLFYEAQRSGKLPANQRVKWRKDSAVDDVVTGGYYDAGDYVKFGFPMAAMTTMVAWGAVDFKQSYKAAGQWSYLKEMIKWSTDYFIKAHVSDNEFIGQIGLGDLDHKYWGRPEDMKMRRPASMITKVKPGSELAAETAAALAAAAIIFKTEDAAYSKQCLQHAKTLYQFAENYKGTYSNSIPDAAKFYKSYSGYNDELAWGATWLYRATKDRIYLNKAKTIAKNLGTASEISWDNKIEAVNILLAALTKEKAFREKAERFCKNILQDKNRKTKDGLVFIQKWGSLRHASNVAYACLFAEHRGVPGVQTKDLARKQINYILGDNSRKFSYLIGFGKSYPKFPHHASSSCPKQGPCNWNAFNSKDPNPQILYGALVGGPKSKNDNDYTDKRNDYITNEVTTDYNAGFQSALAALLVNCK